ncbi:MAG TPA: error-prone DNA polymerase [Stellaceae bacterium]|jgi:error-prone DNA polymerase|nr:error-prone DNA polymerase [Stellaceae bacterium]
MSINLRYAELQTVSNFSFLRGASHPGELVVAAKALGMAAIALTDRNTLAGVVRAHIAAKDDAVRMRFLVGARLDFLDAASVLVYPTDRAAYGRLAQVLTDGKRRAKKGECHLILADLFAYGEGQRLIAIPPDEPDETFAQQIKEMQRRFPGAVYLAASHRYRGDDRKRIARLGHLADASAVNLIATNDVLYHAPDRRALQDVVTCIREGCTIAEAGFRLEANAERHLKQPEEMARLFRDRPDAVERTLELVRDCRFSLDELKYEYPAEPVPEDRTPQQQLAHLIEEHLPDRFPDGVSPKIRAQIDKEMVLIEERNYAPYFLTVYDIVKFARSKEILCQGRGSAANSVVCYILGVTAVNPNKVNLLFERFVSANREEPPDIDVDFEHERREEVMQYIFNKYGRDRAGIVATVISYRPRSAIRDVGKAMGLSADSIARLSSTLWGWGREGIQEDYIREAGIDPDDPHLRRTIMLAGDLIGFPRHLSQHTGGFVITRGKLSEVVPIENAAMDDRTVIEWDKDDIDTLGMLKIDVLALGMLTCIQKAIMLLEQHYGIKKELYQLAYDDDDAVYDMLCKADSVGVFQVESRAQMTMLPRLKPRSYYDLVIEVAIVRPGPIQGDMVHPYLRRRDGLEKVDYQKDELKEILLKTLGVPLFQEQAMSIAMTGARFTPAEANDLRRAMATFRRVGTIGKLEDRFIRGMTGNDYTPDFARRCFDQIKGFGDYGFPESHAASFALLVYASAWLKCFYPAVFACAILNSQPMGFYAPAQLVRDAKEHGVEVRPVDIAASNWDHTLESDGTGGFALRLGFRQVKGFREEDAKELVAARAAGDAATLRLLWQSSPLKRAAFEKLADGDGWNGIGLKRRDALWAASGLGEKPLPLFAAATRPDSMTEPAVALPAMSLGEEVTADYNHLRLSLKAHPLSLLRPKLKRERVLRNRDLAALKDGQRAKLAGLVLVRQQPGTAKGVIFMTLEDETGVANIVLWPDIFARFRRIAVNSRVLGVEGKVQRDKSGFVIHVIADRLVDLSTRLAALDQPLIPRDMPEPDPRDRWPRRRPTFPPSRDFH